MAERKDCNHIFGSRRVVRETMGRGDFKTVTYEAACTKGCGQIETTSEEVPK